MKRMPLKWLGLAAAAALLASGCTAQPQNANRVNQSNLFTTTGDADTCAAALGNTVGANAFWGMAGVNRNVTANGVIIGNVALVALPRESQNTPVNGAATGTGGQNGAAAGNGVQTGAAGGNGVPMGTTGNGVGTGTAAGNGLSTGVQRDGDVTGNLGTLTPPGTVDTTPGHVGTVPGNTGSTVMTPGLGTTRGATGVVGGRVESPSLPGTGTTTGTGTRAGTGTPAGTGTAAGTGTMAGSGTRGGTGATTRAGTAFGTRTGTTAADPLERVRTACPTLADIRVVNDETDRARLAEITAAVRSGRPVTEFMSELATMAQRATSAGPGASGRQRNRPENFRNRLQQGNLVPGRAGTPTTPAPAAPRTPPAPNAPGTDGRGSTPARPGTGTATDPGTSATD